jgi:pentatricopeptide repeat protein
MESKGIRPDAQTYVPLLLGCTKLVALSKGIKVHDQIRAANIKIDTTLGNALINMYGKCGMFTKALEVFHHMETSGVSRDIFTWSTIIQLCGIHKQGRLAIANFEAMKREATPNRVVFIALLQACSHSGFVTDAMRIFKSMQTEFGITPEVEHYNCVVDALSRAGQLAQAYQFICSMNSGTDAVTWKTLLGACRWYKDVELATISSQKLLELDPGKRNRNVRFIHLILDDPSIYVLMGNLYASLGRWEESRSWTKMMNKRGITKSRGVSWIEINGKVHTFGVADKSHPLKVLFNYMITSRTKNLKDHIYAEWQVLRQQLLKSGHVFDTSFVLHEGDEDSSSEGIH